MRRSVLKLLFAVTLLLLVLPFKGTSLLATGGNWCSCSSNVYLYYVSQYGDWTWLDDNSGFPISGQLSEPIGNGINTCIHVCYEVSEVFAQALCDNYSGATYANRHYQILFNYYFDDYDDMYGGSGGGTFNAGSPPSPLLYCP